MKQNVMICLVWAFFLQLSIAQEIFEFLTLHGSREKIQLYYISQASQAFNKLTQTLNSQLQQQILIFAKAFSMISTNYINFLILMNEQHHIMSNGANFTLPYIMARCSKYPSGYIKPNIFCGENKHLQHLFWFTLNLLRALISNVCLWQELIYLTLK